MRKGDWLIAGLLGLVVVAAIGKGVYDTYNPIKDRGIPFYSTASEDVQRAGADLYRNIGCRDCHTIWGIKNIMETVPAPSLDGIGSLRSETWLFEYFSAENPRDTIPTRLKLKYSMPSYASLPESERRLLAKYFSGMKVKAWYLEEVKASEYKKLTGNPYPEKNK